MALLREGYEPTDQGENLVDNLVGGIRIVLCDVVPDIVEIREGFRVAAPQSRLLRRASVFAFKRAKAPSPSMGCTRPDFRSS